MVDFMGLRINTNTQSLAAQRNLGINYSAQKNSIEKLASGSRIVRSADDAAGLAISEKIRGSLRSLRQATRNSNDGISMIQVAEGAMNEVSNILIRFRELSIQGASDTIGDTERAFIDKEVQQLKSEIDRVANATEFNSTKLLNGDGGQIEIQIGINNTPDQDRFVYDASKTAVTADRLGVSGITTLSKQDSQNNLEMVDNALKVLVENRAELGAMQNRLQSVVNNSMIYDENLSNARSRIADVDVASETAELAKQNILTSAGVSVLSQANQNTAYALKLIG
jgi:flagellin